MHAYIHTYLCIDACMHTYYMITVACMYVCMHARHYRRLLLFAPCALSHGTINNCIFQHSLKSHHHHHHHAPGQQTEEGAATKDAMSAAAAVAVAANQTAKSQQQRQEHQTAEQAASTDAVPAAKTDANRPHTQRTSLHQQHQSAPALRSVEEQRTQQGIQQGNQHVEAASSTPNARAAAPNELMRPDPSHIGHIRVLKALPPCRDASEDGRSPPRGRGAFGERSSKQQVTGNTGAKLVVKSLQSELESVRKALASKELVTVVRHDQCATPKKTARTSMEAGIDESRASTAVTADVGFPTPR